MRNYIHDAGGLVLTYLSGKLHEFGAFSLFLRLNLEAKMVEVFLLMSINCGTKIEHAASSISLSSTECILILIQQTVTRLARAKHGMLLAIEYESAARSLQYDCNYRLIFEPGPLE
ncbi:MAP kinase 5 [Striga asiatica]|uniref:MAP kinase 5 n=1 Tax=Striga asiatica TaxID=4170 RepID=A0A5A7Q7H1_STRAF|nr:MAP kinase 5 [Striga asiatica]